ncbi:MmcQ/YjbR family DNA-binding protein [bacterium]|nr:MmcQ/YjbR family DNA-binding protein [bacterium]
MSLKAYCRSLPHVTEDVKWDDDLVFSVGGKMFAVFPVSTEDRVSFKTTTSGSFAMLTSEDGIVPAPYLARYDWVLIEDLEAFPVEMVRELLAESYQLVLARLPRKTRKSLE